MRKESARRVCLGLGAGFSFAALIFWTFGSSLWTPHLIVAIALTYIAELVR